MSPDGSDCYIDVTGEDSGASGEERASAVVARHGHQRDMELPVRLGLLHGGSGGGRVPHRLEPVSQLRSASGSGTAAIWTENRSSTSRRPNSSSTSCGDSSATRTPRRGRCSTKPCWPSRRSASRSGALLVPKRRVSCSSISRSPGTTAPLRISLRSRCRELDEAGRRQRTVPDTLGLTWHTGLPDRRRHNA